MSRRDPEREGRWRELVTKWEQSGQSARAFCQERGLNVHTFYKWRRELRHRDGEGPRSGRSPDRQGFVQVEVTGPSWLELSVGADLVLRVPASVNAERLAEILAAARKSIAC